MYLSVVVTIFSILFILTGVAGFYPEFFSNRLLFGAFQVNLVHNLFNIILGVAGLLCSTKYNADRRYLQVVGIIFGLLAINGAAFGNLWITDTNMGNTVAHAVIGVIFLVLGFSANKTGKV